MEVPLALLADYANVSQDGKLNVMGVFDRIFAREFPAVHPEMRLVMTFAAGPAEKGSEKQIELKLLDADGMVKLHLTTQLTVPAESPDPTVQANHIVRLTGLVFEHPGRYQFSILVNGDEKKVVAFTVEHLPAA